MSDLTRILSKPWHGGSPTGISYYAAAYECARKATLRNAQKALEVLAEQEDDTEEASATSVGTIFHALQEGMTLGELAYDGRAGSYTASQAEAIRLYAGWVKKWTDLRTKYGMTSCEAEVPLGYDTQEGIDAQAAISMLLGCPLTGRVDFAGHIDAYGMERTYLNTGLTLPEPGLYGGDWKTSKSNKAYDKTQFEMSLQGAGYIWMWNLQFPHRPMKGMIFDKTCRHVKLEDKSFSAYLVLPNPDIQAILTNFVQAAAALLKEGRANPGACLDHYGRICPFMGNGCPRF